MLRLSQTFRCAVAAAAFLAGSVAVAQLAPKLDAAEQKLAQDERTCRPIDLGEYARLLNEAGQNKLRAEKMKKKGVPVDDAQVNADLAKASVLLNRAQAALVGQCMRAAQQQALPVKTAAAETPKSYQWIDVKTGKAVASFPVVTDPATGETDWIRPDAGDRSRAFDPRTGRNFARNEKGEWIDVKTGKIVASFPVVTDPATGKTDWIRPDIADRNRAFDPNTGRNFARDEAPPSKPPEPAATAPAPPSQSMNLNPFARDVLGAHNAARAEVGAPALRWNEELAQHATDYAQVLARTGELVHAPREGRGTERENLQKGLIGWSPDRMIQDWAKEKNNFVPGNFPDVARDGNWLNVAHYTQMIWPTTTEVGCGSVQGGGFNWFVCRYNPGGNKDGKPVGIPIEPQQAASAVAQWLGFGVGPVSTGLDINVISGTDGGLGNDVNLDASTNALIDQLFRGQEPTSATQEVLVDTKVEQPTLPSAEVYKQTKVATSDKQEPSNPRPCGGGVNFWKAEEVYKAAKAEGDVGGMEYAKGLMQAAIGRQWQSMEASTEAGEMLESKISTYSLGDFLGKMMDGYKELTGALPPGYYESPNGFTTDIVPPDPAAPELPTQEVYGPDGQKKTCDVM